MPKVSVIIPVYNAEAFLRQCLDTVLGQTLRDIEVVCVDDGSTDGSAAVLAEYAAKDQRVTVLKHPENGGQGAARNRGLDAARGEYVYFMDADDELAAPDALERLAGETGRLSLDILFFDAETAFDPGAERFVRETRPSDYFRVHDYSAVRTGAEMFLAMRRNGEYSVCPPLAFFRRGFLEANGLRFPGDGIIYEDNVFSHRAVLAAGRVAHRPWRLYTRRVHAGTTVTKGLSVRNVRGFLANWRAAREFASDPTQRDDVRRVMRGLARGYRRQARRVARLLGRTADELCEGLAPDEADSLREAMRSTLRDVVEERLRAVAARIRDAIFRMEGAK